MKKAKRWTALLLTFLMLINGICVNAFAADNTPISLSAPETATSGLNVTVDVKADATSVADGKLVFTYDAEKLSYVDLAVGDAWSNKDDVVFSVNHTAGKVVLAFACKQAASLGVIFSLTFTPKVAGEAYVALDGDVSYISDLGAVADQTANISVEASLVPAGHYRVVFHEGQHGTLSGADAIRDIPVGETVGTLPAINADFGYKLTGWLIGDTVYTSEEVSNLTFGELQTVTITAQYEIDAPAGMIPVGFFAGSNGTFASGGSTIVYVAANGSLTADQVPGVTPKPGYSFSNWTCSQDLQRYSTSQILRLTITEPIFFTANCDSNLAPSDPVVPGDPTPPSTPGTPSTPRTEVITSPDGIVVTIVYDEDGNVVEIIAELPEDCDGKELTMPIEIEVIGESVPIELDIPETVGSVAIEFPVGNATWSTVIVLVHEDGAEEVVPKTALDIENGTVSATFEHSGPIKIVDNVKHFVDDDMWAKNEIAFVAARNLLTGTAANTFDPDLQMTRGMLMTVLARLEGVDTSGGSPWYAKGMEWAMANGISDGSNPEANISRQDLVTMLYRYAGEPAANGSLDGFSDAASVSDYAVDAMKWAIANGIISGMGDGTLNPTGEATRAQLAKILTTFINL